MVFAVFHGNAGAGKFQHGQVVIPVPKGKDVSPGDVQNASKVGEGMGFGCHEAGDFNVLFGGSCDGSQPCFL